MKILAIVLVVGVAGYAIYDLFLNNSTLAALGTQPGTISSVGTSVPGVPIYSQIGTEVSNAEGAAGSAVSQFSDAFGPSGNQVSDDEDDISFSD